MGQLRYLVAASWMGAAVVEKLAANREQAFRSQGISL
jgi:hypothetical protein